MADAPVYPPLPPPPGALTLRPLSVSDTIDAALSLFRRHWKQLITIVAVIEVPYQVVVQWFEHFESREVVIGTVFQVHVHRDPVWVTAVVTVVGLVFVTPLVSGAMTRAVAGAFLDEPPDWRVSLRYALGKVWVLLVALLLTNLIVFGGFLLLIVPGIIFTVRLTFVAMAVVVEDRGPTKALGRSWGLSQGRFWPILGTLLIASFLAGFASLVFLVPSLLIGLHDTFGAVTWIVQAILASAAGVVVAPFVASVVVLMYFDCRTRNEGFDAAALGREIG